MKIRKIKVVAKGPYIVSGGLPLSEKIIAQEGDVYIYKEGRPLPQGETYALCRCGASKKAPFCDGAHLAIGFQGDETASKAPYLERAERLEGPDLDLLDDGRCAFARFCHRHKSDAWELTERSDNPRDRDEAITAATECPAGRLVAVTKSGREIEPALEPAVEILQDPDRYAGCGIYVKGGVPVESADGSVYEVRNRIVLCRCGASKNKPFCDAAHISIQFDDSPDSP